MAIDRACRVPSLSNGFDSALKSKSTLHTQGASWTVILVLEAVDELRALAGRDGTELRLDLAALQAVTTAVDLMNTALKPSR